MFLTSALVSALILASAEAAPAAAADARRTIDYADLDLSAPDAERQLRGRLSAAIDELCRDALGNDDGGSRYRIADMRCRKQAWQAGRAQIRTAVDQARVQAAQAKSAKTIAVAASSASAR